MNKKMLLLSSEKIGAFMMIIALFVGMLVPVTAADDTEDDGAYLNDVALLERLEILAKEDGMQYSEETVARENFASMLGVFFGISRSEVKASVGRGLYEDVDTKAPNCALIEKLSDTGVMEGYKDRRFRPSADLTVEQAAKAFVVLLGYDIAVFPKDSAFAGYTDKAQELELFDGIKKEYSESITKRELVKMFMNALDTEVLQLKSLGYETKYETVRNETLLSEKLDVYKIEGVLQATDVTGIGKNDACKKGYIIADGFEIQTDADMNPYLGMELEIYCRGDEDYEELKMIHFIPEEKKNQTLTVDAADFVDVQGEAVSYEEEGKLKKIKLQEDVTVIYNGKNRPLYSDDTFKLEEGNIRFLDADKDGKYEVVFIKEYFSVWVGQIYNDYGNVYIIDKNDTKKKYSFDIEALEENIIFMKDNAEASYSDITNKSVVSIAADKMNAQKKEISEDAEYFEILISNKYVSGKLEGIDKDERELKINGTVYDMGKDFDLKEYDISLKDTAKFYQDAFGKIVAAEKGESNLYGIIDKAFADESGEYIEGIKIFTADGAFKTLECAKKITVDSIKLLNTDIDKITEALETGSKKFFLESGMNKKGAGSQLQLVRYSTNSDGQVIMIDTLTPDSDKTEIEKNNLKFSKKFEKDTRYFSKSYAMTIDGGYIYDSNIVVFRLPSDKSLKTAFAKKSGLDSLGYEVLTTPVFAFDVNEYNYIPIILAESDTVDNVNQKEDNNMMIFENLTTELSEDEEACYVMNGTSIKTGGAVKAYMQDEKYQEFVNLGIKSGDIIRWTVDDLGVVTSIEQTVKNIGNESVIMLAGNTTGINATGYYSDFRITCGTVEKFDDKYILFNLGTRSEASLKNPSAKVLVYNSKTKKTEKGDYSAIKTKEAFGSEASLVFTYQWYTAINTIVIFN